MLSIRRQILRQLERPGRHLYSSTPRSRKCPSCNAPLPSPLPACSNCWHISSLPQDTKYHDIFGLAYEPNPFIVDLPTLKDRFRNAQSLCHPDSWISKGSKKYEVAQNLSAQINEAYQCLKRPLSRAEYILERHDLPVSETEQVNDVEFMGKIMEARETIEDATEKREVEVLIEQNADDIQGTVKELEMLIGSGQWEEAKSAAVRLRYHEGIERAAKKWIDNIM